MGNVMSTIVQAWPGLLPGSPSQLPAFVVQWVVYVTRLSLLTTKWCFGLTTVHLPTMPHVGLGALMGKHPSAAVMLFLLRTVRLALSLVRHIISPDLMMRQLLAVVVLQSGYELFGVMKARYQRRAFGSERDTLVAKMQQATTFSEWRRAASQLDYIEGHHTWRYDKNSPHYDSEQVQLKLKHLQYLMRRGDVGSLQWHLRGELLRKHLGLTNPKLFNVSYVGTKHLVEEYTHAVAEALDFVCDSGADTDSVDDIVAKLAFFNETRHAYGRSAFLLSGGASLGVYHLGVIRTLVDKGLLPRVISGASAGSIAAAVLGAKTDQELIELLDSGSLDLNFFGLKSKADMEGAGEGAPDRVLPLDDLPLVDRWWHKFVLLLPQPFKSIAVELRRAVPRWMRDRTLLDIEVLGECLRRNVGDLTFEEAYEKTGRIINITVTPHNRTDYPTLLNYLTAPHVLVWSAALASCAIPGVFAPVELVAKDRNGQQRPYLPGGLRWSDGSVECDLPMERLSELFNVNVFLVSQVNPHARLFASTGLRAGGVTRVIKYLKRSIKDFIRNISDLGLATKLQPLGIGLLPLLTQKYEGDCTIVPEWTIDDVRQLVSNPSSERLKKMMLGGMRATWPKVSWIRIHCLVELTLDECVTRLRDRLEAMSREQEAAGAKAAQSSTALTKAGEAGAGGGGRAMRSVGRVPSFLHQSKSIVALADMAAGLLGRSPSQGNLQRANSLRQMRLQEGSGSEAEGEQGAMVTPVSGADVSRGNVDSDYRAPYIASPDTIDGSVAGSGTPLPGRGLGGSMRYGSTARLSILNEAREERQFMRRRRSSVGSSGSEAGGSGGEEEGGIRRSRSLGSRGGRGSYRSPPRGPAARRGSLGEARGRAGGAAVGVGKLAASAGPSLNPLTHGLLARGGSTLRQIDIPGTPYPRHDHSQPQLQPQPQHLAPSGPPRSGVSLARPTEELRRIAIGAGAIYDGNAMYLTETPRMPVNARRGAAPAAQGEATEVTVDGEASGGAEQPYDVVTDGGHVLPAGRQIPQRRRRKGKGKESSKSRG